MLAFVACSVYSQPATFNPRGIGGGGSLYFPSINPGNASDFYVACDMGELFHSTDQGLSYSTVDFTKIQTSGLSTFEFTNNASIAYCLSNNSNNSFPAKTTDGGLTWTPIAAYNVSTYGDVYAMSANYNNPQQLLIDAYGYILFSNNGGTSFTIARIADYNGSGITMGGVFWDGNNIYIGTNEGLIYSTNGGTSFTKMTTTGLTGAQQVWSFAGAKTGTATRFVCIAADSGDVYNGLMPYDYYAFPKAVYVMNNANGTWVSSSTGINFSNDYVMYATMAANDINTIYLGGHDVALSAPLVYKSANGGTTWNKIFNTTTNANIITGWEGSGGDKNWSWSETCFGITAAPNNSSVVMFGSYSNVEVTSNGGTSWQQAYLSSADQHPAGAATPKNHAYHSIGLEPTSCWDVFWQDANNMMAGFSDIGGIRSTDAGVSWGFQYSGFSTNSLYRIVKNTGGTMFGACSNIHDLYQSTRLADAQLDAADANGIIVYSTNNGAAWTTLHSFGHPVNWIAIDPNNQNKMYASVIQFGGTQGSQVGGIYMTNDLNNLATSTWTKLANPPRTEGHPASINVLNDGKMVCTFSGRRNSSGAFTASSGVFIYDPVLTTWTDVSDAGMDYWTMDLVVDPSDATQNTWYACVYSGWGGAPNGLGGLYRTTNRGTSWTKLTGSQFDRVMSITFNPQLLTQAYLTTETQGLWVSSNMNQTTPTWTLVSSYPFRQPLRVFFNPYNQNEMWVSSFGNGMKMGNLNATGIADFTTANSTDVTVYPNPNNGEFNIAIDNGVGAGVSSNAPTVQIYNAIGQLIFSENITLQPGENSIMVSLKSATKGIYFGKINIGDVVKPFKMVVE